MHLDNDLTMFCKVLSILVLCFASVDLTSKYCSRTNLSILDQERSCEILCTDITDGNPGTVAAEYINNMYEEICSGTSGGIDLTIQKCSFPNSVLNSSWFSSKHNLSGLFIISSNVNRIEDGAFNGLTKLKYLKFENTIGKLQKIDYGVLKPLTSLEILEIVSSVDDPNVLYNLTGTDTVSKKLQTVQLNGNNLPYIDANMLSGLSNIKQLYIEHSKLKTVSVSVFSDFAATIEKLSLVDNTLETLPEGVFEGFRMGFVSINLNDNNFTCDCALSWLQKLASQYTILVKCSLPAEFSDMFITEVELCRQPTTETPPTTVSSTTETPTTTTTMSSNTTMTTTTEQSTTTSSTQASITTSSTEIATSTSTSSPSTEHPSQGTIEVECETDEDDDSAKTNGLKPQNKKAIHKETLFKHLDTLRPPKRSELSKDYFLSAIVKRERGFVLPKPPTNFRIGSEGNSVVVDIEDCEDCSVIYLKGYTDGDQIGEDREVKCKTKIKKQSVIPVSLNTPYMFCLINSDYDYFVSPTSCTTYTVTSNTMTILLVFVGMFGFIGLVILSIMSIQYRHKIKEYWEKIRPGGRIQRAYALRHRRY